MCDFISEADSLECYVEETVELVLKKEDLSEQDRAFFLEARDNGPWESSKELQERILMRGAMLDCLPRVPVSNLEQEAFWGAVSHFQRIDHIEMGCTVLSPKGFSKDSCPCYVCGGKCLRRLYGKNPVTKPGDRRKGYLQWERSHILPQSCGKNDNIYNLRIMCVDCNRRSGSMFPSVYALTVLPINVETLATKEDFRSILDVLKTYFEN